MFALAYVQYEKNTETDRDRPGKDRQRQTVHETSKVLNERALKHKLVYLIIVLQLYKLSTRFFFL